MTIGFLTVDDVGDMFYSPMVFTSDKEVELPKQDDTETLDGFIMLAEDKLAQDGYMPLDVCFVLNSKGDVYWEDDEMKKGNNAK